MISPRYEISVWNIVEGDLVKKCWEATEADLSEVEDNYGDDPFYNIVIDREWEDEDDDEDVSLPNLALTIRQPCAHAIAMGWKNIENRKWFTKVRGPMCIHASVHNKRNYAEDRADYLDVLYRSVIPGSRGPSSMEDESEYVFGAIIGTATIVDCVDHHGSQWFFGRYGFVLTDQKPLEKPMPLKGALGFFDWRKRLPEIMDEIHKQQIDRPRLKPRPAQGSLFDAPVDSVNSGENR